MAGRRPPRAVAALGQLALGLALLCLAGCAASGHRHGRVRTTTTPITARPADIVTEYPTPNPADTVMDAGSCRLMVGLSRAQPAVHRRLVRACAPARQGGVAIVSRRLVRSVSPAAASR